MWSLVELEHVHTKEVKRWNGLGYTTGCAQSAPLNHLGARSGYGTMTGRGFEMSNKRSMHFLEYWQRCSCAGVRSSHM